MIKLWNEAKDSVTWFQWIVTSVTQYLTWCDRIVLTPKVVNGEIKEWASFDINSCELISEWVRAKFFPEVKIEKTKVGWPEIYKSKAWY